MVYADHPTKAEIRQETYFVKVVLPFIEKTYPVQAEASGRLLVGFSKSGWGAFSLLLRHPDLFGKAAAWDAPLLHEFNWKKEVLQSTEPVLVDFWALWCGPCWAMKLTIEALAKDFKVCKVNVDTKEELAAHYQISSILALLIFKNGQIAARHVGVEKVGRWTSQPIIMRAGEAFIAVPEPDSEGLNMA